MMNKDSITDYFGFILLKILGPVLRFLPLEAALFIGRRIGDAIYTLDRRHRAIVYANIRVALGGQPDVRRLKKLTKQFYQNFGQNIIDIFLIPSVDKRYLDKYTRLEGREHIDDAFKRGKGVIFVGVHEGSWEFYNVYCANLGIPFFLFVRDQKFPRINGLLNRYRMQKGCHIVKREKETRQLIEILKNNQAMGMSLDQGGRTGLLVDFFGKRASMATGAIRLALKYNVALVPSFFVRERGAHVKIILEPVFEIQRTGHLEQDIENNLRRLVAVFEKNILKYPAEYFWSYKVWKYSDRKNILILNDGKTGHLRQSQAMAKLVTASFKDKGVSADTSIIDIKIKSKFSKPLLILCSLLGGKYSCQGCMRCLKHLLLPDSFEALRKHMPDVIISCGSTVAPVNYVFSRQTLAKSIVIMQPSMLDAGKFDLVVMPKHDMPKPNKRVLITEGALNLIDEVYLNNESDKLVNEQKLNLAANGLRIGLLIGGDSKGFKLAKDTISKVVNQLKNISGKFDAEILVTTSRRTSPEIEELLEKEFRGFTKCKLLIIANRNNSHYAIGGILGLCSIVVTSPESISMISEAVDSKKYVVVFNEDGLGEKHKYFLNDFAAKKYINLVMPDQLYGTVEYLWVDKPVIKKTTNDVLIREAVSKII